MRAHASLDAIDARASATNASASEDGYLGEGFRAHDLATYVRVTGTNAKAIVGVGESANALVSDEREIRKVLDVVCEAYADAACDAFWDRRSRISSDAFARVADSFLRS